MLILSTEEAQVHCMEMIDGFFVGRDIQNNESDRIVRYEDTLRIINTYLSEFLVIQKKSGAVECSKNRTISIMNQVAKIV